MYAFLRLLIGGIACLLCFFSPINVFAASKSYAQPGMHSFTVPEGVTELSVTMWGAGGGGSGESYDETYDVSYYSYGGAGGYSYGTFSVVPGETLTVIVGGGGMSELKRVSCSQFCPGGYGGGGRGASFISGSGGGMSAVFRANTPLVIAGGGGGGTMGGLASRFTHYQGGAGGGLVGEDASRTSGPGVGGSPARGGSQTAGGAGGGPYRSEAGSRYRGGDGQKTSCPAGGGGGGGYFGGGSGSSSDAGCTWGYQSSGAGGSGYIAPIVRNGVTIAGIKTQPPKTDDPLYVSGVARGGEPAPLNTRQNPRPGGNGLVVLTWTANPIPPPPNHCTDTSFMCRPDGNLISNCGRVVQCPQGCDKTTHQCIQSCIPTRVCNAGSTAVVNSCTGAVIDDCVVRGYGWRCENGLCIQAPITFVSFPATSYTGIPFTASGHLQAIPALLREGDTTRLYWKVENAARCTVTGSNGDRWTALSSGTSGKTSSPIRSQTTYTLYCEALAGANPPFVKEHAIVNIVPQFREK